MNTVACRAVGHDGICELPHGHEGMHKRGTSHWHGDARVMDSLGPLVVENERGVAYPPLVIVEWTDTTNIAEWTDLAEIPDWAPNGGFVCRNIGYLVHEDRDCVVLAARVALEAEPKQVGLYERIPKGVITNRWNLSATTVTPTAPPTQKEASA